MAVAPGCFPNTPKKTLLNVIRTLPPALPVRIRIRRQQEVPHSLAEPVAPRIQRPVIYWLAANTIEQTV